MADAYRDQNFVPTLIGASTADGKTPVRVWADPTTHRMLVDNASSGITKLAATGTVNGVNTQFTFASLPSYIVSDGLWYEQLDANSNVQWSWNAGTLTATMTIPPSSSIFGVA